jgi:hypothetical protein
MSEAHHVNGNGTASHRLPSLNHNPDKPAPLTVADALRMLAELCRAGEPLHASVTADGVLAELSVRPAPAFSADTRRLPPEPTIGCAAVPPGTVALRLTETEAEILEAVAELEAVGVSRPGGQQVAERAGVPHDKDATRCIATLRRRCLLGGEPGDRGYWLTDAGRAALEAYQAASARDGGPPVG